MKEKEKNIVVDFEPISRRIIIQENKTFHDILVKTGIQIRTLCGGLGTCGKCRVLVQKGKEFLIKPTQSELQLLNNGDISKGWRLACQIQLNNKLISETLKIEPPQFRVFLPDELILEDFKILTTGDQKEVQLNPAVRKLYLEVKEPSLENPVPDLERIINSIKTTDKSFLNEEKLNLNFNLLKNIPEILRDSNHKITLTLLKGLNDEIISCELNNTVNENFGIAFDIGTTTIVGYLINLNDGKTYSVASMLNPQTAYGEDVITRITYVKDNEKGLEELNSAIVNALNNIILKNCSKANIKPSQIYEATVVGNSVMHHIFLGINPNYIGQSPYVPVIQRNLNLKPSLLGLNIYPGGNIYMLPLIAGFVGADTMGVILSSNIEEEKELTLVIDIGTNGEIIIGKKNLLVTSSCAAGSALEGAHIKDGMRAASGAIDSLNIDPDNYNISFTTIKNKKPIGICGSGLIDAVAEMLKAKIITRSGNFNKNLHEIDRLVKKDKSTEFIIVRKEDTSLNRNITISQSDIRQLQMAKAAFYAGMRMMLMDLNIKDEIKQIYLAGAFGNYIDKDNTKFIGMIPDINSDKIFQIGNAAGIGAQNCLLNIDLRKKSMQMLKKIQYVEIATKKEFQREFAEAMYFPHMNLDLFPNLKEYRDIPKR
jgi:uncharacterized 2Fe-2S/4Fe-4S cluster protein (DUF4445 family)